ncbi:hypothetical protein HY249_01140 [Candidatus Azambacteria bacterium]|nr:hypothetical protein [Candidatus Azambacteria bacterium]
MKEFINSIQEKPKSFRVKIFAVLMIALFAVIFALWISSVRSSIGHLSVSQVGREFLGRENNMPTIYESISASVKDIFEPKKIQLK